MGLPVLILGESGTGKSASLRNFPNDVVAVVNVAGKPLPFKNKIVSFTTDDYMDVEKHIKQFSKDGKKSIIVDDAQYLMANEFMRRATERGFDKFTDIAKNFWSLINMVKELPEDVIVYFLAHIERDANGNEKIKTIGKLLDEKITVEGMFTIVLKTNVTDGQYSFITQNNGHDTVKSPIGMFATYAIDNDLYYVDNKIRNYYEMGLYLTDDEIAKLDEINANENVTKESAGEKKGRRNRKQSTSTENTTAVSAENETDEKPPKARTRRRSASVTNAEEVDNSNADENKDELSIGEEVPQAEPAAPEGRTRKSREEKEAANAEAVSNAGIEEAGDKEEVPFDDVDTPPVEPTPRRRRRRA